MPLVFAVAVNVIFLAASNAEEAEEIDFQESIEN